MTPEQMEAERVRFEAWAKEFIGHHIDLRQTTTGSYEMSKTWVAFESWLAAKQDAKEQA